MDKPGRTRYPRAMRPAPETSPFRWPRQELWAWLLILLPAGVRLVMVATGQVGLVQDEAQYWDWSRQLDWTYYSKGPLIAWLIAFWTGIFGHTELGVRIGAVVGSVVGQGVLWWGLSRLWGLPGVGLAALVVANTMPAFMASGLIMTTDNPLLVCWLICFFAQWAAMRPAGPGQGGVWPYMAFALALGCGILAKYLMLVFPLLGVAAALLLGRRQPLPPRFWPRYGLAVAEGLALGFLPILLWNIQHDWVGFKHVFHLVGVSGKQASRLLDLQRVPDFLGGQLAMVTPWWLGLMLVGSWRTVRRWRSQVEAPDAFWRLSSEQALYATVFFASLWGGIFLWSFHAKILANWPSVSYVGGLVLAGAALEGTSAFVRRHRGKLLAASAAVVLLVHLLPFLPLPARANPALRLLGWDDLGRQVAAEQARFADPGRVFIFSDLYDLTAALAFYVPGQPRTYCAWLDRRMTQYDLWPGPEDKVGWDAVYVMKEFKERPERGVERMFARLEGPIHVQTQAHGAPARRFTLFRGYGFTGYWPRQGEGRF